MTDDLHAEDSSLSRSVLPELLASAEPGQSFYLFNEVQLVHSLLSQMGYLSWISLCSSICHFHSLSGLHSAGWQ